MCSIYSVLLMLSLLPAQQLPDVDLASQGGQAAPAAPSHPITPLPISFIENAGQMPADLKYYCTAEGIEMFFSLGTLAIQLRREGGNGSTGAGIVINFEGASDCSEIVGIDRQPTHRNFFIGNNSARWIPSAHSYGHVRISNLYSGIDVAFRDQSGRIEYDLLVSPGADLSNVTISASGVESLMIDDCGNLVMHTLQGDLMQTRPRTFVQYQKGAARQIDCRFRVLGPNRYGFDAPDWTGSEKLVIDPGFVYSTYLGGTGSESVWSLAVDMDGSACTTGPTVFGGFPVTPGAFDITYSAGTLVSALDGYVSKLTPDGSGLVFSTYLGGSKFDWPESVFIDDNGAVYVSGATGSIDFPVTSGAFQGHWLGWTAAGFVAKLNSSGSALTFSTYIGGSVDTYAFALAVDSAGAAIVAGHTTSPDLPVTPAAYDTSYNGMWDGFIAKLASSGSSLMFAAFLGGSDSDFLYSIAVDPQSNIYVAGITYSFDYPTTPGAFDKIFYNYAAGITDAVVTSLCADGTSLIYSTLLGGLYPDGATGISVDDAGSAYVCGYTYSFADFPITQGSFAPLPSSPSGVYYAPFVTKLSPHGSALEYSTSLGSLAYGLAQGIAVDSIGAAHVVARTGSKDFLVTPGAVQPLINGTGLFTASDAYFIKLTPDGANAVYATFLGGEYVENANASAPVVDTSGRVYLAGGTQSAAFPVTSGAFQQFMAGAPYYYLFPDAGDTYITKIELPIVLYGSGTPGCQGTHTLGTNSPSNVNNSSFQITCNHAPPSSLGLLLVGSQPDEPGTDPFTLGVLLHISFFSSELLAFDIVSDASGRAAAPTPIPNNPALAGQTYYAQALWYWPLGSCNASPLQLSSSRGMAITIVQ